MRHPTLSTFLVFGALCVSAGCSATSTYATASGGSAWIANGLTACQTYLTPNVVATIWAHPAGQSKAIATGLARVQGCVYDNTGSATSIKITLNTDGPASFDAAQQYLVDPVPLPNVGDKAFLTADGIVAVKGADRTCHIDAYGNEGSITLSREALGKTFGAICNKLFALP